MQPRAVLAASRRRRVRLSPYRSPCGGVADGCIEAVANWDEAAWFGGRPRSHPATRRRTSGVTAVTLWRPRMERRPADRTARKMSVDLMFLSMVQPGQKVRLVTVQAGRGLRARLAEMGLVPGVELEVINRNSAGPFIVAVKQSRIMLGRGMAHRIVVS